LGVNLGCHNDELTNTICVSISYKSVIDMKTKIFHVNIYYTPIIQFSGFLFDVPVSIYICWAIIVSCILEANKKNIYKKVFK